MEDNRIFKDKSTDITAVDGKKPLDIAALVLSIVTVIFAAFMPLISYVCGIIGLVFAIRHRKDKNTTVSLVLCIVGLFGAVISTIIGAALILQQVEPMIS